MTHNPTEVMVGGVVIAAAFAFAVYTAQSTGLSQRNGGYELAASFRSLEGVSVGTDVRLAGVKIGTVTQVLADAFVDEASQASYYRTEIQLNEGEADKLPEGAVLIPGMPVEAFIRTADQSPIYYLVKPLADYFNKAFRES